MWQSFYKESKSKFDADPEFKEKAQKAVVRLQVNNLLPYLRVIGVVFCLAVF